MLCARTLQRASLICAVPYKMAEAKGEAQLAKTARENYDRISNKMK
ncbi:MAG TPA: hypothetical protein VGB68_18590 [Pyrinomonadaceae bacterium]|jgi:hypothetical protein